MTCHHAGSRPPLVAVDNQDGAAYNSEGICPRTCPFWYGVRLFRASRPLVAGPFVSPVEEEVDA
jgi:hypothetical protein